MISNAMHLVSQVASMLMSCCLEQISKIKECLGMTYGDYENFGTIESRQLLATVRNLRVSSWYKCISRRRRRMEGSL